ncbi:VWA domain-containing protein [Aestuariicella hydrocarbonica]|uniref:VWA domain-containing protein n=1 Tax=Pseudomaricurvus hydrocarbonicus TaxID=1470433 RepID=A0A9E5MMG2_9GAMM|nr:VWA domain-containing protein [Aestuariicella hydrocarbonica]NHO66455.1 VWA domain-containing protein [Aestuariicella hydrocarbonica]
MLHLEWPWVFALLPLPWIIYRFWPAAKQEDAALLVPFFERLPTTGTAVSGPSKTLWLRILMLTLIWLATLTAAARPMWVGDAISMPASGRDLLLSVDISGSMETRDMQWQGEGYDRLSIVKMVVGDFVKRREADRLGLILFGSRAYLQAPLTFDRTTVNQLLQEAQLGFAGEKTAIGDAIGLGVKRLRERPQDSRVMILLTDGANTSGQISPLKAAELAAKAKVKIYTIGVGADEMVTPGLFGSSFGARRINPSADLDESTLKSIAQQTGGIYFRARSPEDLQTIYLQLDKLEPIDQEAEVFRPTQSLFYWALALALGLCAFMFLQRLAQDLWHKLALSENNGPTQTKGEKRHA